MPITETDIDKLAALAQLEITDDERRQLTTQVAAIITYVEQLNELDTGGVEPSTGGFTDEGARTHATRNDTVQPSLGQQAALDQAPDPHAGFFRVPKIVGSEQ
ncbi:MAG: Asp-tRNA(Asn)/Glu-tRNA(Gln) amidotransferase subunit GatC [Pyrinomonadaceae bacterium MAG19_C2-C3]|nr:Asp-tRNA(Asn)/Glu-tRNA(Gln) amidotransferase subunit GatC [Pyrinomonadaceae bacterium MAG19_C2-C3]